MDFFWMSVFAVLCLGGTQGFIINSCWRGMKREMFLKILLLVFMTGLDVYFASCFKEGSRENELLWLFVFVSFISFWISHFWMRWVEKQWSPEGEEC